MDPRALRRFFANRGALLGLAIVVVITLFSICVPWFTHSNYTVPDFDNGIGPFGTPGAPSWAHPLGTDTLYRDLLVRMAHGGRLSLTVALFSTVIAIGIGTLVGVVAGFFEGTWIDMLLMRLVDVLLAFPYLLLLMAIATLVDRISIVTIVLTLGLTGWAGTARIVRSKAIQIRSLEYVMASRALGQTTPMILWLHILPNVMSTVIVLATGAIAGMIVAESALSFLGLSIPLPQPSWGRMLDEARPYYATAPWLLVAPAFAILLAVLGFNLLGEGLRDAVDPKD
jgi:ABC-type dipeptide/oligopeptide/nickel transport system permease subunit